MLSAGDNMELPSYQEATLDKLGNIQFQVFEKQPCRSSSWYFTNTAGELILKYSSSTLSSPALLRDASGLRVAEVRRRKWNSISTYNILLRDCKADIKLSCSLLVFDSNALTIGFQKRLWKLNWVPIHSLRPRITRWQLILRTNGAVMATFSRNEISSGYVGQLDIAGKLFGLEALAHHFPRLVVLSLAYIAHTTELQTVI
ncbi:hypothetical protein DSO57_1013620 [Entomophthora muscae]|uniref:Uncharacterized protein n=1 Tax=Entomophthora muscae TaxID=34485 RepID=A0ACC2SIE5_9FUNG|nr:hypothetical protein DSO57_1013620 [Entomophthora muscae]